MIYLFSDFGFNGPYVGQMKSVLAEQSSNATVIDLMHDAPVFNSKAAAHLLAALAVFVSDDCIVLGIVDPGVGSERKGVVLRADSRWYVGPDNGLFDVVASRASKADWYEIIYENSKASPSFHGRDIFSPVAALLHNKAGQSDFLLPIDKNKQTQKADLTEVIYIDRFGNLMTGIRASHFDESKNIWLGDLKINRANTFSDVEEGRGFYYENSQGLLEIAVNSRSAEKHFGAAIGDVITIW